MNGTNGNQPGYPENALVPYPVIVAATKGDPDAMKIVLQHFSGYIARLSMRKLYDNLHGDVYKRQVFGIISPVPLAVSQSCLYAGFPCSFSPFYPLCLR